MDNNNNPFDLTFWIFMFGWVTGFATAWAAFR